MMERPPLYTDVYGFPLAAAGPLPDAAFGIPHPTRAAGIASDDPDALTSSFLDYGFVSTYIVMRDRYDPERTERQSVALGCEAVVTLEHGDSYSSPYIVTLTGTVGHPTPGDWVQWVGLKHLVGNVFHATGWLPWTKDTDDAMRAMTWDYATEPRIEPRIDLAALQQSTTGEST